MKRRKYRSSKSRNAFIGRHNAWENTKDIPGKKKPQPGAFGSATKRPKRRLWLRVTHQDRVKKIDDILKHSILKPAEVVKLQAERAARMVAIDKLVAA